LPYRLALNGLRRASYLTSRCAFDIQVEFRLRRRTSCFWQTTSNETQLIPAWVIFVSTPTTLAERVSHVDQPSSNYNHQARRSIVCSGWRNLQLKLRVPGPVDHRLDKMHKGPPDSQTNEFSYIQRRHRSFLRSL